MALTVTFDRDEERALLADLFATVAWDDEPAGIPDVAPDPDDPDDDGATREVAAAAPVVDPAVIQAEYEQAVTQLTGTWQREAGPLVDALAAAVAAEVAAGMLGGLAGIVAPATVVAGLVEAVSAKLVLAAGRAARTARRELPTPADTRLDDDTLNRLHAVATGAVDLIVGGYTSAAGRLALAHTGTTTDPEQVAAAVARQLTDMSRRKDAGLVAGNMSAAASTAQAAGREMVFRQAPDGTRWKASEVNDRHQCAPCRQVDGTVYASLDAALADYPAGKHIRCEGLTRCRGLIHPLPPTPGG